MRLDYRDRKRSAAEFNCILQQRRWRRSEHVDVRDAFGTSARSLRSGARALFRTRTGAWAGSFVGKPTRRMKHVLHMFCERTVLNIKHVACWWRGTAFSPPNPTAACSRTLPLARDLVAFFCLWLLSTHNFWDSIFGITMLLARHENRCLERPNIVLSVLPDEVAFAQTGPLAKKQPSRMWPERSHPTVCVFGRVWMSHVGFLWFCIFNCLFGCIFVFFVRFEFVLVFVF